MAYNKAKVENYEQISAEEIAAWKKEVAREAKALFPTLQEGLKLAPLLYVELPKGDEDEMHLIVTGEILAEVAPELLVKYDELTKTREAPDFIRKHDYDTSTRKLPERAVHDQFNPYRKNKITTILDPSIAVSRYLEDEDLLARAKELKEIYKDTYLNKRALVDVDFARSVYEFGAKVAEAYNKKHIR